MLMPDMLVLREQCAPAGHPDASQSVMCLANTGRLLHIGCEPIMACLTFSMDMLAWVVSV